MQIIITVQDEMNKGIDPDPPKFSSKKDLAPEKKAVQFKWVGGYQGWVFKVGIKGGFQGVWVGGYQKT